MKAKRILFVLLLLLVAVTAIALLDHQFLIVKHVEIKGNETISSEEIVSMTGLTMMENLLRVDTETVKANLERTPYLRVLSIERHLPNTLVVQVKERHARAAVTYLESDIFVDETGLILEIRPHDDAAGVLRVDGVKVTAFAVGTMIQSQDEYQLVVLRNLLDEMIRQNFDTEMARANLESPGSIVLYSATGLQIKLGQAVDLAGKFTNVRAVLHQLGSQGITSGTINATNKDRISYSPES